MLEEALHADFAFIKADIGDEFGNLYFEGASKNFSLNMAMASKVTIVEVEKLVKIGELKSDPNQLPGVLYSIYTKEKIIKILSRNLF